MNGGPSWPKRFLGGGYPLAKHFAETTALFVVLLVCLFIVRHTIPLLFPPSETLSSVLQVIDAYAALLGIVGYGIWITLDMATVLFQRAREFSKTLRKDDDGAV